MCRPTAKCSGFPAATIPRCTQSTLPMATCWHASRWATVRMVSASTRSRAVIRWDTQAFSGSTARSRSRLCFQMPRSRDRQGAVTAASQYKASERHRPFAAFHSETGGTCKHDWKKLHTHDHGSGCRIFGWRARRPNKHFWSNHGCRPLNDDISAGSSLSLISLMGSTVICTETCALPAATKIRGRVAIGETGRDEADQ